MAENRVQNQVIGGERRTYRHPPSEEVTRMKSYRRQRGISIWLAAVLFICLACIGLVALKLFPVYMESLKVDHALKGVIQDPNVGDQSKREIAFSVVRRLDIDGVYLIKEKNWTDYLTINKKQGKVTVQADWRKEVELFGNLSLLATFSKEVTNRP